MICDYGCNREAEYRFKNGKYCCSKSYLSCPAVINPNFGNKQSEKCKNINSALRKDKTYEEMYGIGKALALREERRSQDTKERKVRMKNGGSNYANSFNHTLEIRNKTRERMLNGQSRTMCSIPRNPEKLKVQYEKNRDYMVNGGFQKLFESFKRKPTKLEIKFVEFLNEFYPNEWKYVGDGYTWIAGKNPDFMNINGKKQLIELFGTYWHKEEDEPERINHFKKYGFDTLVIWEKELKDLDKVKTKIGEFIKGYYK